LEALVGSGIFYGAASSETQAMEDRDVSRRSEQVPAAALFVLTGGEPRAWWLPGAM
jgi:thioredoxin reductase (NADPH)